MYKLYAFFAIGVLLMACNSKINSGKTDRPAIQQALLTQSIFPDHWIGEWVGELSIYRGKGKVQSIPMEMTIEHSDTPGQYIWSTVYSGKDTIVKPYELHTLDQENGLFLIDEKNTIAMETYLFDQKLVSWFEVQGSMILASHELRGDQMVFEIIAGSDKAVSTSGDSIHDGEEIPAVRTFPVNVMQRGLLRRKK